MAQATFRDRWTTALLSAVAGYVDTAGFLSLNGLFTAHVTGNLVVAGAEIAGLGDRRVWVRLAVIPGFILASLLTTTLLRTRHWSLARFLGLEALTLLLFTLLGVGLADQLSQDWALFAIGSAGVFAMGVQNALMREAFGNLAPTTIMTGNLTQFTIDLARLLVIRDHLQHEHPDRQQAEIEQRVSKFGLALLSFTIGAALGAVITAQLGLWSISLPTIAIALLAWQSRPQPAHSA